MAFTGKCKSFKPEKGFGFIITDEGTDVFLHIKACADGCYPVTGDTLTFDIEDSALKPGQIQAANVRGGSGGTKGGGKGGGGGNGHVATGSLNGQVKSFAPSKGYGFIVGPDGSDVFLHVRAMVDGSVPSKGDTLSYDAEPSDTNPGQMVAKNVAGGTGWPIEKGGKDGGYGKGDGGWGGKDGPYGKGGGGWGGDSWGGKGKGGDDWGGDGGGKGGKMAKMMEMMMSCMDAYGGDGGGDSWGGKGGGGGKGKGKGGWGGDGGW